MAVDEDAPIIAFIDAEAGLLVVVGRAQGLPAPGSAADFLEPSEEAVRFSRSGHSQ